MSRDTLRSQVLEQIKTGVDSTQIIRDLQAKGLEKHAAIELYDSVSIEMHTLPEMTGTDAWWLVVILGAFGTAVAGGLLWTLVVVLTGREMGLAAWGIGALCGLVVAVLSKGRDHPAMQLLSVISSLVGILIGKYGTFCYIITQATIEQQGAEAARQLSWYSIEMLEAFFTQIQHTVGHHDLMWIALAMITAWSMPKRAGHWMIGKKTKSDWHDATPDQEQTKER